MNSEEVLCPSLVSTHVSIKVLWKAWSRKSFSVQPGDLKAEFERLENTQNIKSEMCPSRPRLPFWNKF